MLRATDAKRRDPARMRVASLVVMLGISSIASSDPAPIRSGDLHGFVWQGQESLDGRVTDAQSHGVAAEVHVVVGGSERVIKTARDGRYHITLQPNTEALVFVLGALRITSTAATSHGGSDGETVDMHELLEPTAAAKLKKQPRVPPYTDDAKDYNQWIRAWVLVDIDEHGVVQRVKLLDHPGFGLDDAAVRAAFALPFEPARDLSNRPMRSQMLWPIDWPAFAWFVDTSGVAIGPVPDGAGDLPCAHNGPARRAERACNDAPIAATLSAPWILRSKVEGK
jgi:hypothetical protein